MEQEIKTIMSKDLVTLSPDQTLRDAKHIFERSKFHHHIPVVQNNELVGMISLHDFLYASEGSGISDEAPAYGKKIREVMMEHPRTLSSTATIREAADILVKNEVHALVITEGKTPVGIVSTADLLRYLLRR